MLQQLGPTYVKLGQMVASRREALPPALVVELEKLQSDVAPFPWEQAEAILVDELGRPVEDVFIDIEHEPFAAASTAQVHRATLPDGRRVAVKIQRPRHPGQDEGRPGRPRGARPRSPSSGSTSPHKLGAQAMVREFAKGVIKELDYRNEAYHAQRIAESMQKFPEIHIPVVDPTRSTARVLTAEFVKGIKISDVERLRAAGHGHDATSGRSSSAALIKQVLVDGFFHGDPHPGNVLVDPETGQIIFLDFGLVGRAAHRPAPHPDPAALRAPQQGQRAASPTRSSASADARRLGRAPVPQRRRPGRPPVPDLRRGRHRSAQGISAVLGAVFDNGLRLDNDLTLAIKAVVQAEETAMILAFDLDIATAAFEEARDAVMERLTPEHGREDRRRARPSASARSSFRRLPTLENAAWSWLDQFGKGKLVVEIDTSDLNAQIAKVSDLGRQVAIGMLVTGQLIGTAILAVVLLQPRDARGVRDVRLHRPDGVRRVAHRQHVRPVSCPAPARRLRETEHDYAVVHDEADPRPRRLLQAPGRDPLEVATGPARPHPPDDRLVHRRVHRADADGRDHPGPPRRTTG